LSQTAEKVLNASERKVLRKMYGPVLVNGQRRNRQNHEICKLYKETEMNKNIRLSWLQSVGSVFEDEERKGAQESTERVHQKVQELEKVG
jgi:hypothetical protein